MKTQNINISNIATISIDELTSIDSRNIFNSLIHDEFRIITENNKPIAALISIEKYLELLNYEEELRLIQLSIKRIAEKQKMISREKFLENNGVSEDYLNSLSDIELD